MIVINQPYIYKYGNCVRLESEIEISQEKLKIWYEVDEAYGTYLCDEIADAFLLAALPLSAKTEQDILIHGNVSPKLLYNANMVHTQYLAEFFKKKPVKVSADKSEKIQFGGKAVITGCSLGVDSLSTIYQHIDSKCEPDYRLTHLTLFNSCQLGDLNQEKLEEVLKSFAEQSKRFADEVGLPFFTINSNVTLLMQISTLNPTEVFHYFTIGCALSVQKMIGKYILSSSYTASHTSIDHVDISHNESAFVPLLGTENVEVILSDTFATRTQKTRYISKMKLTPKYLDVCWATQTANMRGGKDWYLTGKIHRNCGWCDKCMRTLLTLELNGELEKYSEAFDLDKYYANRKFFIFKVVYGSNYNTFYNEILTLMKEKQYRIPFYAMFLRQFDFRKNKLCVFLWNKWNIHHTVKKMLR